MKVIPKSRPNGSAVVIFPLGIVGYFNRDIEASIKPGVEIDVMIVGRTQAKNEHGLPKTVFLDRVPKEAFLAETDGFLTRRLREAPIANFYRREGKATLRKQITANAFALRDILNVAAQHDINDKPLDAAVPPVPIKVWARASDTGRPFVAVGLDSIEDVTLDGYMQPPRRGGGMEELKASLDSTGHLKPKNKRPSYEAKKKTGAPKEPGRNSRQTATA